MSPECIDPVSKVMLIVLFVLKVEEEITDIKDNEPERTQKKKGS